MFSELPAQAVVNNPCWEVAKAFTGDGLLVVSTSVGRCTPAPPTAHNTFHITIPHVEM